MKTYKTHNKCLKSSFASVNAKKKKKKDNIGGKR